MNILDSIMNAGNGAAVRQLSHQRYIDDPAVLAGAGAVGDGNGILGRTFGRS